MIKANVYRIDHLAFLSVLNDSYIPFPFLPHMFVVVSEFHTGIICATKNIFLVPFLFDGRSASGIDGSGE
jgi:hypothetical protein